MFTRHFHFGMSFMPLRHSFSYRNEKRHGIFASPRIESFISPQHHANTTVAQTSTGYETHACMHGFHVGSHVKGPHSVPATDLTALLLSNGGHVQIHLQIFLTGIGHSVLKLLRTFSRNRLLRNLQTALNLDGKFLKDFLPTLQQWLLQPLAHAFLNF